MGSVAKVGATVCLQVADYARRKGMEVAEVEQWLGSRLNYEPEEERGAAERRRWRREAVSVSSAGLELAIYP